MQDFKAKVGGFLYYAGLLGLPGGVGIALGYYAGAWGVRWLPTMLGVFLTICIVSLMAIIAGRSLTGGAIRETAKGLRLRKRVIACFVLLSFAIIGRLVVYLISQPCALTEMSAAQFDSVFQVDMQSYFACDRGMDEYISRLEDYSEEFGEDKSRVLTADEEKLLRSIWIGIYDYAFSLDRIYVFYSDWYRFDPSPAQGSMHQRSFLLALAAEASLYEKAIRFIKLVDGYENVVKFLNTPCDAAGLESHSFSKFRQQFQNSKDHGRIAAGRRYLLWMEKGLKGRRVIDKAGCMELWDKVEMELAMIDSNNPFGLAEMELRSDMQRLKRKAGHVWFCGQRGVARMMGKTRVRRVGKYLITPERRDEMENKLEPGDIMLSRKNWYLSNVGLPGFWPHAIFYLGSPEKFEKYFDDAEVKAYLKGLCGEDVELGDYLDKTFAQAWLKYSIGSSGSDHCVIEGLSPGIVFNTMKATCGDYMAAVRPKLSKKAKAQAVIEAFSHFGKNYDFNFDFATDHALVCTELVWRSYRPGKGKDGLNIKLAEVAGRKTLPANEIAKQFAQEHGKEEAQFEFVYFLDAVEETQDTFFAAEEDFLASHERLKWSFAQD